MLINVYNEIRTLWKEVCVCVRVSFSRAIFVANSILFFVSTNFNFFSVFTEWYINSLFLQKHFKSEQIFVFHKTNRFFRKFFWDPWPHYHHLTRNGKTISNSNFWWNIWMEFCCCCCSLTYLNKLISLQPLLSNEDSDFRLSA